MKLFVALLSLSVVAVALAIPAPTESPEEYEKWVVNASEDFKQYVVVVNDELAKLYESTADNKNALIVAKIDEILPNLDGRLVEATGKLFKAPTLRLSGLTVYLIVELKAEIEVLQFNRKRFA